CSLLLRPPPSPTLFPYTTLFRSTEKDPDRAAADRHQQALGQELRRNVLPRGPHGAADADLMRAFDDRRQHDVHDPDAADNQRERSEEHTSELQSPCNLVCRLLLE